MAMQIYDLTDAGFLDASISEHLIGERRIDFQWILVVIVIKHFRIGMTL
jgi:hypothetical protein